MQSNTQITTKNTALTICFTALYTILSFIPLSPIVGFLSKAIVAATILAPIIGVIIGPKLGAISAFLGGTIAISISPYFTPLGLVAGVITALFAGMLAHGKHAACVFLYFSLLFLFGFYPFVGPVWLYPPLMWFQIIGLLILISPLQPMALKTLNSTSNSKLLFGFFITSLTSTLAGQIAGSLTSEVLAWPIFLANISSWEAIWKVTAFLYPVERIIIALSATFIGASVHRILKSANLSSSLSQKPSESAQNF
jgi:hypothetical protein